MACGLWSPHPLVFAPELASSDPEKSAPSPVCGSSLPHMPLVPLLDSLSRRMHRLTRCSRRRHSAPAPPHVVLHSMLPADLFSDSRMTAAHIESLLPPAG